jgi:hypothetical protein
MLMVQQATPRRTPASAPSCPPAGPLTREQYRTEHASTDGQHSRRAASQCTARRRGRLRGAHLRLHFLPASGGIEGVRVGGSEHAPLRFEGCAEQLPGLGALV